MEKLDKVENKNQFYFNNVNIDIENVTKELSKHMRNKLYYTNEQFRTFNKIKITDDWSTKNLRETVFISCVFENANLRCTGLAGSIFKETTFLLGNYIDTNFQSCDFRNCNFENATLKYTSFNKSVFIDTNFNNCLLESVSMCDCRFVRCTFNNCKWTIRIENTLFKDSIIKDTSFRSMNFEFSTFENIHTENIKLPFPTIPFIYGGLTYLSTTDDNVSITSAIHESGISKDEYLRNCLKNLEQYYNYTQNFFPLSNILIAKKHYEQALICISKGLELSILIRKFRMLINYCKLLKYIPTITTDTRQELYIRLMNNISIANLDVFEQENLGLYLPQVTSILVEDSMNEKISVFFNTNIERNEINKIAILYSIIDDLLNNYCTYSIQLRHNSPLNVFLQIFSNRENIEIIIATLNVVFLGIQAGSAIHSNAMQKELKSNVKDESKILINDIKSTMDKRKEKAHKSIIQNKIKINNYSINFNGDVHIHK